MFIIGAVQSKRGLKSMAKPNLSLVAPATVFGAVYPKKPPRKRLNAEVRSRSYLTDAEVERLIKAAGKKNRHGHRDATMVLVTYRHGLRTAEVTRLRWDSIDLDRGEIAVRRAKNGKPGTHPLSGREIRELRRLKRDQAPASSFVFTSERGAPFSPRGFRQMIERLGVAARFDFPVNAHALRHACGFKLANDGLPTRDLQDYLGHRNIQHTVRYTELSPTRFRNFWKD
jgi:type 1 fimbriae regulatory protein FimB/type 1 fimbriae regulatory protein FimE